MDNKPTKGEFFEILLRSPQTIFSTKDVVLLWGEQNESAVRVRLNYYAKTGKLIRVHRGFYAKDKNYNRFELATRIYIPSYISFETVLTREGVNFQYYGNIFVASYMNREITVGDQKITYVRMKDYVLSNSAGIDHSGGIATASRERAFLDRIYVSKEYHFDNLRSLDWNKVMEILPIYHNKRMERRVRKYYKGNIKNAIIQTGSNVSLKEALAKVIKHLESMDNEHILNVISELRSESQKDSARVKLKGDAIFILKVMHDNEK